MRVSDLRKPTKKLKIIYKADKDYPLEIEYRWRSLPFNFWEKYFGKPQWVRDIAHIKAVIISWTLKDDNGEIIPIEDEALKKAAIPRWLLDSIFMEIERDQLRDLDEKND